MKFSCEDSWSFWAGFGPSEAVWLSAWQCVGTLPTPLSIQSCKGYDHDDHGDGGHDGDYGDDDHDDDGCDGHDDDEKDVNLNLKSRSIGFSGVFWVYSGASLVMALYAYLVKICRYI